MTKPSLRSRLALGVAITGAALAGCGRPTLAGDCAGGGGIYSCSGAADAALDVTQTLGAPATALTVTTTAGFGIDTSVSGGDAFFIYGYGGLSFTDANGSKITGATYGLEATNFDSGDLTITTNGDVIGVGERGIVATNFGARLSITAGNVTGAEGIYAHNKGAGDLTVDTTGGTVVSTISVGARVYGATSGTISVTTADVTAKSVGLAARNFGSSGDVMVDTTAGTILALGGGITATNKSDDRIKVTAGDIDANQSGIFALAYGANDVSITTTRTVSVNQRAVYAWLMGAGGSLTIDNSGTLRSKAGDPSVEIIKVVSAGVGGLLDNGAAGTILGRVTLGGGGDSFDNAGIWQSVGDSDFAGGSDTLSNLLDGRVLVGGTAAAEAARFLGLETFNNAGLLDFRDGGAGDSLSLAGDFNGLGGTIAFDVVLDDGSTPADRLVVGGATGGTTNVVVNAVGGTGGATGSGAGHGIALIDVSATGSTTDGDFALLGGPLMRGGYTYDLVLEDDGVWYLQSTLLAAVPGYANAVSATQTYLDSAFGPLGDRLGELRGTGGGQSAALGATDLAEGAPAGSGPRLAAWVRGFGADSEVSPSGAPDFSQQGGGVLLGGDLAFEGLLADGDRAFVGALAGWGHSRAEQDNDVDVTIEGWSLGLYASYLAADSTPSPWDGLRIDALLHVSLLDLEVTSKAPASQADYDATAWGARLAASYGLELLPGLILEPQARLDYVSVRQEDFTDSQGVTVSLDDGDSLAGRLGVRLQRHWDLRSLGQAAPYLEAAVRHEFLGDNRILADGGSFESDVGGTSWELGFGLEAKVGRDLSLYAGATLAWGEQLDRSVQAGAGLRLAF